MKRLPAHYQLVKRRSAYDLLPAVRKSGGIGLVIASFVLGLFCFGPTAIVLFRIFQGLYRISLPLVAALNSILHNIK